MGLFMISIKTTAKNIGLCLALLLCSCYSNKSQLRKIEKETGIQNLTRGNIMFSFNDVKGFDSSGILYYLLDFKNKEDYFLEQFSKPKNKNQLNYGSNAIFEDKVEHLIDQYFKLDYDNFKTDYKINWSKKYLYYYDSLDILTFSLVYYEEESILHLLKLQM